MRFQWLVMMVVLSLFLEYPPVWAQGGKASPVSGNKIATASSVPAAEIPPDAAVITIDGLCDKSVSASTSPASTTQSAGNSSAADVNGDCKTVVTRTQFETVFDALYPTGSSFVRNRFAHLYPETLSFASKARELGLDKDPRFQEKLKYVYLQTLNQFLLSHMQQEANDISDADVGKYYKEHPERFQKVHLLQIFVPKSKEHPQAPGSRAQPKVDAAADEAAMKMVADEVQKKAAAGGDFDKLEEQVYKAANDPDTSPDTDLGDQVSPDTVPEEYQKTVFDLPVGKVSQVMDGSAGWHIFEVVSKRIVPLNEAKQFLQQLRMKDARQSLSNSIKPQYNDAYFAAPTQGDLMKKSAGQQ
jgi:parvulin-like peptidyl-prolyl cis-trans isomerase-like protein